VDNRADSFPERNKRDAINPEVLNRNLSK
jgi:hypothetical protein